MEIVSRQKWESVSAHAQENVFGYYEDNVENWAFANIIKQNEIADTRASTKNRSTTRQHSFPNNNFQ